MRRYRIEYTREGVPHCWQFFRTKEGAEQHADWLKRNGAANIRILYG